MSTYAPKPEGYMDWKTGRVAVLASKYADSDLNGDVYAYYYSEANDEMGLEPWKLVDGVDKHTNGDSMDIWFASGNSMTVGASMTIFLAEKDALRLGVQSKLGVFEYLVKTKN